MTLPTITELRTPDFLSYFWAKVERSSLDGCWLWTGALGGTDGRPFATWARTNFYAYRASYAIAYGVDPGRLAVCHRCDVPRCVRPSHLFLGTQADNCADMRQKGRGVVPPTMRGESHPNVRHVDSRVAEARDLYDSGNATQAQLAALFGVSQSTIGRWTRGEGRTDAAGPRRTVGKGHVHPNRPRSACSTADCGEMARVRGMCRRHYLAAWKQAQAAS